MPELRDRPFDEGDLDPDPLVLFGRWFEEATAEGAFEPNAVALATASAAGAPSARMVLMKSYDERGLTFFTNYGSRKAAELDENPRAALLFHWPELGRQVRIEGEVERVGRDESVAYARSRSRASQLSALASPQSRPVPDRALARAARRGARRGARGRRGAGARRLGRLPARAGRLGVLAAPPRPPPRPLPLRARRARRLDERAARPLSVSARR